LLRDKTPDEAASAADKDASPFKEIMQTMERPPTADFTSPPRSADYYKKPSFFQSFARAGKPNFRLPRSSSMRTPSPPLGIASAVAASHTASVDQRSPPPFKSPATPAHMQVTQSPSAGSFLALSKLRRSVRGDKRTASAGGSAVQSPVAGFSPKRFGLGGGEDREKALASLRDELQASKDEAAASKEVINVLRNQVETLQREKETM
jgi:hypothetical protein